MPVGPEMITLTLPYPVSASGLYRIVDLKSGRFYIGSSVNIARRWHQHRGRLKLGTHPNPILQSVWSSDPCRLVIETTHQCSADRETLLRAEQAALDAADVGRNRRCMNVLATAGSHLGRKRSAATCAALSAASKGRIPSQETREKMRAAKLGRELSAEHKRKLSDAARGKKLPPRPRRPRPELRRFSDDQVRSIRAEKSSGSSYTQLESKYGCSRGALQRLLTKETYSEVQ